METVDPVEVIWLLISLAGTGYTYFVLRDAARELHAVRAEGINSVAELTTKADLWQERRRMAAQLLLDAIGVIALLTPASSTARTTGTWVAIGLLVLFNVMFAYNSYAALRTRRRSLGILRAQARKGGSHA